MKFGDKLKTRRKALGLTQEEVAKRIGISRRSYNMYEQKEVFPRYEKTLEKLADVLECEIEYLKRDDKSFYTGGMFTALDTMTTALGILSVATNGVINSISKSLSSFTDGESSKEELSKSSDFLLQYEKKQKKFQAIAMGLIMEKLANQNIPFTPGVNNNLDKIESKPDQFLSIESESINSWWFSFWTRDEKLDEEVIVFPSDRASLLIGRYATISENPRRKVSIVVDDDELYQELIKFKNHNSFNGNMSIILINIDKVELIREEYIALHRDAKDVSRIAVVNQGGDFWKRVKFPNLLSLHTSS